jgi:hypothetical protein
MPDTSTIVIVYAALGCLIAGIAVTYDVWRRPAVTFPKMQPGRMVFFGLFVIVLWPYLAVMVTIDTIRGR